MIIHGKQDNKLNNSLSKAVLPASQNEKMLKDIHKERTHCPMYIDADSKAQTFGKERAC